MNTSTSFPARVAAVAAVVVIASLAVPPAPANAAPPPRTGPHPRIWLTPDVLAAMKAKLGVAGSHAARVVDDCKRLTAGMSVSGIGWPEAASICGLAYQLTNDPAHAATGLKYWKATVEDDSWNRGQIGNRGSCVAGATPQAAITAIAHDTGYFIRFIGPHAALAYDWLHAAPGVDETWRAQVRTCFKHWMDHYTTKGYFRDMPGANYNAGFVFAKALIAAAIAGEFGADGDAIWNQAVDDVYGKTLIQVGLAGGHPDAKLGTPPSGVLVGGDWIEGWQYGPLSVLEYALGARALEESGASLPAIRAWTDDLILRYIYALTPSGTDTFVGGDFEVAGRIYATPSVRPLFAVLAGGGSDQSAAWAAHLVGTMNNRDSTSIFPALAEVRVIAPAAYPNNKPLWYVSRGTRRVFARSSWNPDAYWSVFESPPYLGPDHQHFAAGNFVFTRGADHLIVDAGRYGSRSTLPTNAPTIDSDVVLGDYKPSQTPWSRADLPFARGSADGVVAARGDYAKAFNFSSTPTDVPFALRDYVFLPEGEIVLIDRTRTKSAAHKTYIRFKTPAANFKLAADGRSATGTMGASQVTVQAAFLSGGGTAVTAIPTGTCTLKQVGACNNVRFDVQEYSVTLPGPQALAVHVIGGTAAAEKPADVQPLGPANGPVVGARVFRANKISYVVASANMDGMAGPAMEYSVPGENGGRHVVFDAPEDAMGRAKVTTRAAGGRCHVALAAATDATGFPGRPLVFSVSTAADGCKAANEGSQAPATSPPRTDNNPAGPGGPAPPGTGGTTGAGGAAPRPGTGGAGGATGAGGAAPRPGTGGATGTPTTPGAGGATTTPGNPGASAEPDPASGSGCGCGVGAVRRSGAPLLLGLVAPIVVVARRARSRRRPRP